MRMFVTRASDVLFLCMYVFCDAIHDCRAQRESRPQQFQSHSSPRFGTVQLFILANERSPATSTLPITSTCSWELFPIFCDLFWTFWCSDPLLAHTRAFQLLANPSATFSSLHPISSYSHSHPQRLYLPHSSSSPLSFPSGRPCPPCCAPPLFFCKSSIWARSSSISASLLSSSPLDVEEPVDHSRSGLQQFTSFGPILCLACPEHFLHHIRTSPCLSILLTRSWPPKCRLHHFAKFFCQEFWSCTFSWHLHILASSSTSHGPIPVCFRTPLCPMLQILHLFAPCRTSPTLPKDGPVACSFSLLKS